MTCKSIENSSFNWLISALLNVTLCILWFHSGFSVWPICIENDGALCGKLSPHFFWLQYSDQFETCSLPPTSLFREQFSFDVLPNGMETIGIMLLAFSLSRLCSAFFQHVAQFRKCIKSSVITASLLLVAVVDEPHKIGGSLYLLLAHFFYYFVCVSVIFINETLCFYIKSQLSGWRDESNTQRSYRVIYRPLIFRSMISISLITRSGSPSFCFSVYLHWQCPIITLRGQTEAMPFYLTDTSRFNGKSDAVKSIMNIKIERGWNFQRYALIAMYSSIVPACNLFKCSRLKRNKQ